MNYQLNPTNDDPPSNPEAEESLIGSCLLDGDTTVLDVVSPILVPSDFFTARCQFMFDALLKLADQNKPLDEIHIVEMLNSSGTLDEVGGIQGIMRMMDAATTELQATHYAKLISEKSKLRKLIRQCRIAQEYAQSGT